MSIDISYIYDVFPLLNNMFVCLAGMHLILFLCAFSVACKTNREKEPDVFETTASVTKTTFFFTCLFIFLAIIFPSQARMDTIIERTEQPECHFVPVSELQDINS